MKKAFLFVLAAILGFTFMIGCSPEEKAKTEKKAGCGGRASTIDTVFVQWLNPPPVRCLM
jgi:hypothetical protein